jgi:hypothetical protein
VTFHLYFEDSIYIGTDKRAAPPDHLPPPSHREVWLSRTMIDRVNV